MRSTEGSLIASQVVRVRERFERWRRDRPGRRPLPAELWSAAVNLARQYGLSRTANALRLSSDSLKQHIQTDAAGGRKRRKPQTPARFIELPPWNPVTIPECSVELENARGVKIKIQLKGTAMNELPTLARLFLE